MIVDMLFICSCVKVKATEQRGVCSKEDNLGVKQKYIGVISFLLQIIVLIFIIFIFVVSLREKKGELISCQENLDYVEEVTH